MSAPRETIRTFLAVYPDPGTLARIADATARFRGRTDAVRWTPDHQLHFTLRFFGDLDLAERRAVVGALDDVAPGLSPVSLALRGTGAFPGWSRPRVIWVGAGSGGDELEAMARRFDQAFEAAGLGRADKPFRAHLTIGRVREGRSIAPGVLNDLRACPLSAPAFRVGTVRLMGSRLGPSGAAHTELYEIPLGEDS